MFYMFYTDKFCTQVNIKHSVIFISPASVWTVGGNCTETVRICKSHKKDHLNLGSILETFFLSDDSDTYLSTHSNLSIYDQCHFKVCLITSPRSLFLILFTHQYSLGMCKPLDHFTTSSVHMKLRSDV